ncbi:protein-L-isoaspartate(D-aspartate) O-methyltransferase [Marispirochaeta sp.]|jgi:protein-L-isoaspartate(D-aspartate) O-methyltransferase|uniref:protein-L-isoaspartate(D-aspartate) O-methyltransferase n=1 Tax=Marispirochaeta sp. TaxID=2038653 RepID=UPI0029C9B0E6|nr:protein-L-isoaspartate(D-aspartate) O-methyltransferase [Marispirochaeta sp.]
MLPLTYWDIHDPRVLEAIRIVPRERFVPPELQQEAEEDRPLPIGQGQTISQPYIVAYMTEVLRVDSENRVLEIGTGSGYQAAVLSLVAKEVYSVERIGNLAMAARERLKTLGYGNIHVRHGDGSSGWPESAPFDRIMITAAVKSEPPALVEQLRPGGFMVFPQGGRRVQYLVRITKDAQGSCARESLVPVVFVPFVRGIL